MRKKKSLVLLKMAAGRHTEQGGNLFEDRECHLFGKTQNFFKKI